MRETNWTARIIFSVIGLIVLGVLVAGYVGSMHAPPQQHYEEAAQLPPG